MTQFNIFIGKTVESVDTSCVNYVVFKFTDGTSVEVYAECGTTPTSIPYFDVYVDN